MKTMKEQKYNYSVYIDKQGGKKMKDSEILLIKRSQKGDVEAFEELIRDYKKIAFNIALRILKNKEDAEDISQEALIKAYSSIDRFNMKSTFKTWLYRIVVNSCLDFKRKRSLATYSLDEPIKTQTSEVKMQIEDNKNNPDVIFEKELNSKMVLEAVNQLEYDFKTIIILRDIQGFSYQEISEILSCNPGTVKSRLNRARKKLKTVLEIKIKEYEYQI